MLEIKLCSWKIQLTEIVYLILLSQSYSKPKAWEEVKIGIVVVSSFKYRHLQLKLDY